MKQAVCSSVDIEQRSHHHICILRSRGMRITTEVPDLVEEVTTYGGTVRSFGTKYTQA